jgi:DNA replication and repair protein RecF
VPVSPDPRPASTVVTLTTLDFRNLEDATIGLGPGLTVVVGPNGAGKTNLLEAVYFALVGRSCRTANDRELVEFGRPLARAEVLTTTQGEEARFLAAISFTDGHRHMVDGSELTARDGGRRPAVAVFMPDRLGLVKGAPGGRRAHVDRLAAALWPSRAPARASFGRALAQRNALLARIRGGSASPDSLDAWDRELAGEASRLIEARSETCRMLEEPFATAATQLGLPGEVALSYRPRCDARDADGIAAELRRRRGHDLERAHTTHGPHHDEIELSIAGRSIRRYGSQGQQRTTLLALLFAERELLTLQRGTPPLMLLDDVMSELDPGRRTLLTDRLADGGQALLTATDPGQLPSCDRTELELQAGRVASTGPLAQAA